MSELAEELKNLSILLEKNLAVLKMSNSDKITETKERMLKNETKRKIYELCNGKNSVSDIVKTLGTTQPNVSYHLSSLLESGLLIYLDVSGNRYYTKTLE